jgi:shikimate kinase
MSWKFDPAPGRTMSSSALAKAIARSLEAAVKRKLAAQARLRRRVEAAARRGSLFTGATIIGMA